MTAYDAPTYPRPWHWNYSDEWIVVRDKHGKEVCRTKDHDIVRALVGHPPEESQKKKIEAAIAELRSLKSSIDSIGYEAEEIERTLNELREGRP